MGGGGDKAGAGGGGGRRPDRDVLPFSEEILCTKTDLDEKNNLQKDFSLKLTEMESDYRYQNKIKVMEYEEQIRELKERARHELDSEKVKYDVLVLEKNDMEMDFEKRKKQLEEENDRQMKHLADDHRAKLMREMEQCNVMSQEKTRLQEKWEERSTLLLMGQQKYIQERSAEQSELVNRKQENVLREESELNGTLERNTMQLMQVEEDIDREIWELRDKYDQELKAKQEESLQMKGTNGVLQKKFKSMEKEITEKEEDITMLLLKHTELHEVLKQLADQAQKLQEEIDVKDVTIGERETTIYELKKKNQELEKFKFVLDHKIKALRQQIEPKDEEIVKMKEKIATMDGELERYRRSNSQLESTIESQRDECDGLLQENLRERSVVKSKTQMAERFRGELHEAAQHIQEPRLLKEAVKQLFQKYVTAAVEGREENADIAHEYQRQKQFLERSVDTLKKKLSRDMDRHKQENHHIMQENASLIQEIRELRREQRELKVSKPPPPGSGGAAGAGMAHGVTRLDKELAMQRDEMSRLEGQIAQLEQVATNRPISRERLPPMDHAPITGGYNDA